MINTDTGRIMPQPGERWRVRWRPSEGPDHVHPCGHTKAEEQQLFEGKQDQYLGKVFLVVETAPLSQCPLCGASIATPEGHIAIAVPDWRPGRMGMVAGTVPYTWLEPEDWRPGGR